MFGNRLHTSEMQIVDKLGLAGHWAVAYWPEWEETLCKVPRKAGRVAEGLFWLSPPVVLNAMAEGIWSAVNAGLNIYVNIGEEEVFASGDCVRAASIMEGVIAEKMRSRITRQLTYGTGASSVTISVSEFVEQIERFADFLRNSASRQRDVVLRM